MPSKVYDRSRETLNSEVKERKHKRKSRHRNSSSHDGRAQSREGSTTRSNSPLRRRSSMPVPELDRRPDSKSPNGSKISLPYPSFSKAHSREAVGSKEALNTPDRRSFTPDATDLQNRRGSKEGKDTGPGAKATPKNAPPSPPLTATEPPEKREGIAKQGEEMRARLSESRQHKSRSSESRSSARASLLRGHSKRSELEKSDISLRRSAPRTPTRTPISKIRPASVDPSSMINHATGASSPRAIAVDRAHNTSSQPESDSTSTTSKEHSSETKDPRTEDNPKHEDSPGSASCSTTRSITPKGTPFPQSRNVTPAYSLGSHGDNLMGLVGSPRPPPPPPPPSMLQIPRVDYLIQNGGLHHAIPKKFLATSEPLQTPHSSYQELPNPSETAAHVDRFFAPFSVLLDDLTKVMSKNGSIAVATGYRSIARRLLDRLEAVFARDISSETCTCIMCAPDIIEDPELVQGISWGEILEYVCGRQELPPWPAFALDKDPVGLGITGEHRPPMQKLDIDVPEEYRDHYIRQSQKIKLSVDNWLASHSVESGSPPEEADDDTLTFALLTHLPPIDRPVFTALLGVKSSRPSSVQVPPPRIPTPTVGASEAATSILASTSLAIQRLYRLSKPPRSPETAMFLLTNLSLHNTLATLAAISDHEWDILTSGRFDGFLRSGAEDGMPSPLASRRTTPAYSRHSTPASANSAPSISSATVGAPVALDEETEIAVLAEVEREIYTGMEALEDAFEALHCKAELVRQQLRERGAGLSMAAQMRRGGGAAVIEARLGTPASMVNGEGPAETDDGIDDAISELAPDDSASNVSSSRLRRPKRRSERRTPAAVEEEDEEGVEELKVKEKEGGVMGMFSRLSLSRRRN